MKGFLSVNELIFGFQTFSVVVLGVFFASRGKAWLTGWLSLLSSIMNVFVLKQIHLWGFEVTSADVYVIGLLTCLNYAREHYEKNDVNDAMLCSWVISIAFLVLTQLHLFLIPSPNDSSQKHFLALFSSTPRIVVASLVTLIFVQIVDIKLFTFLQRVFSKKYFAMRSTISLLFSQLIDTIIFSFLGLYGLVSNLCDVMIFAMLVKGIVITLAIPTLTVTKAVLDRRSS
ncbi:putative membrane protein [Chlamydia pneumoniae LPCoLN]|uniref:queuosine precursor transporter n=1 Tax=Chlamydia pneumoniae TaxID=83558 RepID=UPI0001BD9CF7|nr:queuosine precursor transporter [Chlamydia pneumoniae]ACZ33193.1 putative membrane protein [Chlamydia pneumoniae LPCoLN]